jgi:hypothetical protein
MTSTHTAPLDIMHRGLHSRRFYVLGGYLVQDGKTRGRTPEPASFERGAAKMTGLGRLFGLDLGEQ